VSHTIINTNVPIVANGHADQASLPCVVACQHLLAEFSADRRVLVLDTAWHILREYMHNLRPKGQPGLGDAFLKWVLTNHSDRKFVAVARAHPAHPPIYNAVDTDWLPYQEALASHGVTVVQICPDDLHRIAARKG